MCGDLMKNHADSYSLNSNSLFTLNSLSNLVESSLNVCSGHSMTSPWTCQAYCKKKKTLKTWFRMRESMAPSRHAFSMQNLITSINHIQHAIISAEFLSNSHCRFDLWYCQFFLSQFTAHKAPFKCFQLRRQRQRENKIFEFRVCFNCPLFITIFAGDKHVLKNLNGEFRARELTAVMGVSGGEWSLESWISPSFYANFHCLRWQVFVAQHSLCIQSWPVHGKGERERQPEGFEAISSCQQLCDAGFLTTAIPYREWGNEFLSQS